MGRASNRLAVLAKPLKPEQEPWYVRQPVTPGLERSFPAEGWYWIPQGLPAAVYLGASFEIAAHELRTLIDREVEAA